MVWMKNFPKKREPYFLYIVTTYSLAGDSANSESERGLFQTLAYKCISKAAADVPQDVCQPSQRCKKELWMLIFDVGWRKPC